MNTTNQSIKGHNTIVRQVVFLKALFELMDIRLQQLGITAPEYVRQLVIEDVKPLYKNIPMVDMETEESIGRALDEVTNGNITKLKDTKAVKQHLNKLSE